MMRTYLIGLFLLVLLAPLPASASSSYARSSVTVEVNGEGKSQVVNTEEAREVRQERQEEFEEWQAASEQQKQEAAAAREQMRAEQEAQKTERETERIEQKEEKKTELQASLCNKVQARLEAHGDRYSENGNTYIHRIRYIEDVLTSVIARFETSEVDVTNLVPMLQKLSADAATFEAHINAYLDSLESVKTAACNGDDIDYREQMTTLKSEFDALKAEGAEIKAYIQDTIKPELQAVKNQVAQDKPDVRS